MFHMTNGRGTLKTGHLGNGARISFGFPAARPLGSIAAERWKGWYPLPKAKRGKPSPWGERANSRRKRDKGIGCGGFLYDPPGREIFHPHGADIMIGRLADLLRHDGL